MTLKEAAKNDLSGSMATYRIGFNGDDETEFDALGIEDLEDLWTDFCSENRFQCDSINWVECVKEVADYV